MSSILRPNGAPQNTRMPRKTRTKAENAALDAVYAQAKAIRDAAFAEATKPGMGACYREIMGAANKQADRLIWEAK